MSRGPLGTFRAAEAGGGNLAGRFGGRLPMVGGDATGGGHTDGVALVGLRTLASLPGESLREVVLCFVPKDGGWFHCASIMTGGQCT